MRALDIDPVHDTRQTFDGLLAAMSRPGTVHTVVAPADHAVVATLVDHEVTVATEDKTLQNALSGLGRFDSARPENADVVHIHEHGEVNVQECKRGTLVEPSDGATVIYRVETVSSGRTDATTVTLSGPGVDGATEFSVSLPERELSALAEAQSGYPKGIDAVFAAKNHLAAIPRSVTVEVA